jgi:hypothetical protein
MRPILRSALAVLAFAVAAPSVAGEIPSTRADAQRGFEWTVPAKWEFADAAEADRSAGYVLTANRVVSPGVEAKAFVVVRDASDLDTAILTIKDNKSKALKDPEVSESFVPFAGASDAKGLKITGKAENGSRVTWFVRAAIADGKYHEMSVRATNGAHAEIPKEIDEVFAGYKTGYTESPTGGEAGGAPAGGGAEAPAETGPKLKQEFGKLGLTWTLPPGGKKELPPVKEGDPERLYEWAFAQQGDPNIGPEAFGLLAVAAFNFNGATMVSIDLRIVKFTDVADPDPAKLVDVEHLFQETEKENFDGTPIPNIDHDYKVGNARGAHKTFTGKDKEGKPLFIRTLFVTLKRVTYRVVVVAHDGFEQKESAWIKEALDGLQWADTTAGIRGPIASPFISAAGPRDKEWIKFNEVAKIIGHAEVKKPKQFGMLDVKTVSPSFKFAAETRKPGAYLFVSIQWFPPGAFGAGFPPKTIEGLIDELEGEFANAMDKSVTRAKPDKPPRKEGSFRGGKGWTYEWTGEKGGVPYLERGWVVRTTKNVFFVRSQYGGKDAVKVLEPDWKELESSIKLE